MGGREDDPPLQREDFSCEEDYLIYLWEAGLAGSEYDKDGKLVPDYKEFHGGGERAAIYRGVLGHDAEQHSVIDFVNNPLFNFNKLYFGITESAWRRMYMGIVLTNCRGVRAELPGEYLVVDRLHRRQRRGRKGEQGLLRQPPQLAKGA